MNVDLPPGGFCTLTDVFSGTFICSCLLITCCAFLVYLPVSFLKQVKFYQQLQLSSPKLIFDFCTTIFTQVLPMFQFFWTSEGSTVGLIGLILELQFTYWRSFVFPQFLCSSCCMLITLMGWVMVHQFEYVPYWVGLLSDQKSFFFLMFLLGPQSVFSLLQPMEKVLVPPGACVIFLNVFPLKSVKSAMFLLISYVLLSFIMQINRHFQVESLDRRLYSDQT